MKAGDFKKRGTEAMRRQESESIRSKFPDRVPIIIEQGNNWNHAPLDKSKYLVPNDVTIYHLQYILRKRLKLSDRECIFLFCGSKLVKSDSVILELYERLKDSDGFLYMTYSQESVFGFSLLVP